VAHRLDRRAGDDDERPVRLLSHTSYIGWRDDGVGFNDRFYSVVGSGSPGIPFAPQGGTIVASGRKLPNGLGDAMLVDLRLNAMTGGTSILALESAGALGARTFDVSNALPIPSGITSSWAVADRPQVTWAANSALTSSDVALIRLRYVNSTSNLEWSILQNPALTSTQYPVLPDIVAQYRPAQANLVEGRLGFTNNDEDSSYDELRNGGLLHPQFGTGTTTDFHGRYSLTYF